MHELRVVFIPKMRWCRAFHVFCAVIPHKQLWNALNGVERYGIMLCLPLCVCARSSDSRAGRDVLV